MDGIHDLGGKHGFGGTLEVRDEAQFHADWELRVRAIAGLMIGRGTAPHGVEGGLASATLEDELLREYARLDVAEDLPHPLAHTLVDDARATGKIAVLGGVRDRVAHVRDLALVDQVDDQLHIASSTPSRRRTGPRRSSLRTTRPSPKGWWRCP